MSFAARGYACLLATVLLAASTHASADVSKDECVDANAKAQPLRREGKLDAARRQLRICIDKQCPGIVREDCAARLDEIEHAQPTIVFEVKDKAGNDVRAVKIRVDGQPLADTLDGTALAVDPGAHQFTFEVAAHTPVSVSLLLRIGDKARHERVVLAEVAPPPAPSQPVNVEPKTEKAIKKQIGQPCDREDDCAIGTCSDGKCNAVAVEALAAPKERRVWIGIALSLDLDIPPWARDVCVLNSDLKSAANGAGYRCVDPATSANFPPDAQTNADIDRTHGDGVGNGALLLGNARILASLDYALNPNMLLGARAGFVLFTYPASNPGPAFPPLHLEARFTYLFGDDALTSSFAPMVFVAGGASEFDTHIGVQLRLTGTGKNMNEDAWLTAGPLFGAAGGGARFLVGQRTATTVAIKGVAAFGGSARFLFGIAPEVGVQFGF
jgi:hypothetical protein